MKHVENKYSDPKFALINCVVKTEKNLLHENSKLIILRRKNPPLPQRNLHGRPQLLKLFKLKFKKIIVIQISA